MRMSTALFYPPSPAQPADSMVNVTVSSRSASTVGLSHGSFMQRGGINSHTQGRMPFDTPVDTPVRQNAPAAASMHALCATASDFALSLIHI